MAIPLNIVNVNALSTDGRKEMLRVAASGLGSVDIETIAQEVSDKCTVTRADVMAVMSELEEYVGDQLLQGKNVRMHALGSFRTTLSSRPAKTEKEVTADTITRVNVRYTPSAYLNKALSLKRLSFEKCRELRISEAKAQG